ncbi:Protein of unknown function DUF2202 [Methanolacinia petrolearia DSM 11571]|uniref:DUF2202 domain-containing protein n=2 Tax=Methanolacinia TaxID=230355 RepID=E1RHH2_METP4|nr:Protein of unknown function DUF2202 [Methanolacinia petrolearia DSM 11571]
MNIQIFQNIQKYDPGDCKNNIISAVSIGLIEMSKGFKNAKMAFMVFVLVVLVGSCGCMQYGTGNSNNAGTAGYGGYGYGQGGQGGQNGSGYGQVNTGNLVQELASYPLTSLTAEEEEWILYMAEEEKLARDAYLYYYDKWGSQVFSNIAGSEQTHMDSMALLIERYGLEDPVTDERGVFTNSSLQAAYDDLVNSGSVSEIDALTNSAYIEELDITDLDEAIAGTDKQDLVLVYSNLRNGSENHLRAFIRNLGVLQPALEPGPVLLSQEEFDRITGS